MKLIVISNPDFIKAEANIVNALFEEGLRFFHLRKPDASLNDIDQLLKQINPSFYERIALHQHHLTAGSYGIYRLHYPAALRETTSSLYLVKEKLRGYKLSTSVHSAGEISSLSSSFDYAFFSPVFNSISKKDYTGMSAAQAVLPGKVATEIIALGGIDRTNISKLKAMQFDGAAVLGALWSAPARAVDQFKLMRNILEES